MLHCLVVRLPLQLDRGRCCAGHLMPRLPLTVYQRDQPLVIRPLLRIEYEAQPYQPPHSAR